jgi:hypothetical protein
MRAGTRGDDRCGQEVRCIAEDEGMEEEKAMSRKNNTVSAGSEALDQLNDTSLQFVTEMPKSGSQEATTISNERRDAINQVVSSLSEDVINEIVDLRKQLDELEKLVLAGNARVSQSLNDHVDICGSVRQETSRLRGMILQLSQIQIDHAAV